MKLPKDASNETIAKAQRWAGACLLNRVLETRRASCRCPKCWVYRILVGALHESERQWALTRDRMIGYTRDGQDLAHD